jgi:hypothetical protein
MLLHPSVVIVPLVVRYPGYYSVAGFQDWLNENPPEVRPVGTPAEASTESQQKLSEAPQPSGARGKGTARDIAECRKHLVDLRKAGPQRKTKEEYASELRPRYNLGPDQFETAWKTAAAESPKDDWGKHGRRSKRTT